MCKIKWDDGIVILPTMVDDRGNLKPISFDILPFTPKRLFIVDNVPDECFRGNHAHKMCEQVIICLSGSVDVYINNKIYLLYPMQAVYLPTMHWSVQQFFQHASILVLCSEEYNENEYIRNYEEFLKCALY